MSAARFTNTDLFAFLFAVWSIALFAFNVWYFEWSTLDSGYTFVINLYVILLTFAFLFTNRVACTSVWFRALTTTNGQFLVLFTLNLFHALSKHSVKSSFTGADLAASRSTLFWSADTLFAIDLQDLVLFTLQNRNTHVVHLSEAGFA